MKKLFNFILAIVCTTMVAKAINSPEPTVVDCGDQLEIKATPETGWHFVEWDDHNTENPRKLTPEDNGAYQAVFALDQHTITFKNWDGTTLQSGDWDYGTTPVYSGETPEKPSTVQYSYSFSGWAPIITVVTQSETYVAQFEQTTRTYPVEITPEDGEGGDGGTVTVEPDGTPVAIGDPVTLTAKANECYEFVQWSNGSTDNPLTFTVTEGMIADEKLSLQAQFQKLRYTITFNNWDNSTLQTQSDVLCGTYPLYSGPQPTKPETAKYLYTFNGWFTKPAHKDTTYRASFNEVYRTYPIDVIPDGGEGGEVTVDPADQPVGIGEIITLTAKPEDCYAFVKWSNNRTENPLTIAVTEDLLQDGKVKIKPVFEHKTEYEITFRNWDGTVLQSGNVNCGYLPVYTAAEPTKAATAEYSYSFDGWNNLKPAHKDTTYTATFTATHITYPLDITPEGGEGGEIIVSPTDPVGVGDEITLTAKPDECHQFIQWSNGATANPLTLTVSEDMLVGGKITLKAQFKKIAYTINFNNWSGANLQTGSVFCGDMPEYTGAEPEKPADAVYTYKFKGWDKEIVAAKGDETYTAVYTEAVNRDIDTTIYMATFDGKEYNDGTPVTPITGAGDYYLDYYKTIAGQLYRYRGTLHVIDVREWDADGGVIHGCDAGETRSVDLPWMSKPVQVTLVNQPFPPAATSTASYGYDNAICKLNYHYKMIPVDTVYENVTVHGIEEFPLKLTGDYTYDWPADEAPNRPWVKKGLALCEPCGVLPTPAPGRKGHQAPGISTHDIMHILSISYEPTKPAVHVSEMIDICQGDTFWFRDTIPFFEKGVYFDTLINYMGLDSVNMIVVNVYPTYAFEDAITLHNKKSYTWVGHKNPSTGADWIISEAGVYIDSLKTIHGCDSIYMLNVTNIPMWEVIEDSVVCQDATPIEWRGRLLYETGIYTDSIHYGLEADTIYQLNLTVNETKYHYESITLCQGETYMRNGVLYTEPGLHYDTLTSTSGCDSIVTFYLQWTPTYLMEEEKTINGNADFMWHGQHITSAGTYLDENLTVFGCDSIYRLTVTVNPIYSLDTTVSVCEVELPYIWQGNEYYNTGVYEKLYQTVAGADSLLSLHLTVNKTAFTSISAHVCQGDSFTMGDSVWKEPGIYYDTLITTHGCDSIVQVIINRGNSYHYEEVRTIYSDESFEWHGQTIKNEGIYVDNQKSVTGCDSTYTLTVTKLATIETIEYDTICYNETPKVWGGRNLYKTGTYTDTLYEAGSTLNIKTLYLTVNQTSISEQERFICQGESYPFFDQTLTAAGTYEHHLLTAHGCDSIIVLHLNVMSGYEFNEEKTISDKELPYHWQGRDLYASGEYVAEYKTMYEACDSIYRLTLTVYPTYEIETTATICETELPYIWEGTKYYATGDYSKYYQTVVGKQDSILRLHLTVNPIYLKSEVITICENDVFNFRGQVIEHAGIYYDSLLTSNGCDSVYMLVVNRAKTYLIAEEHSIYEGETYNWRGQSLTTPGVYYDKFVTVSGCDSIYQLTLTKYNSFNYEENLTICSSETPYLWHGQQLYTSGTYTDEHKTVHGADSIHVLHLIVNETHIVVKNVDLCQGEFFELNGAHITTSGTYDDIHPSQEGCDSITRYVVNFAPLQFHETEATVCKGSIYNWEHGGESMVVDRQGTYLDTIRSKRGCDSIIYRLKLSLAEPFYKREADTICESEAMSYNYRGQYLTSTTPGTYHLLDQFNTVSGCDSTYEMIVTVRADEFVKEIEINLCEGESFTTATGHVLNSNCTVSDTLSGKNYCDSIIRYNVHVHPHYTFNETRTMCAGEAFQWQGQEITGQGHYTAAYSTVNGCDSIYTLEVITAQNYLFPTNVSIDPDMLPYTWRGREYWTSAQDVDSFTTVWGCDSIYTLKLNVAAKTFDSIVVCDSEFENGGVVYNYNNVFSVTAKKDSVYTIHLYTTEGLDSIVELHFGYRQAPETNRIITACMGDVYTFKGHQYTTPASFNDTLKTIDGCDSIVHYYLNFTPSHMFSKVAEMNTNGQYQWMGHHGDIVLTAPGVYWDSLHTVNNCDSIYKLTLLNRHGFLDIKDTTICANSQIVWRGKKYKEIGVYYDSLKNDVGMDSVYVLNLSMQPADTINYVEQICQGESYTIPGTSQSYTRSGHYTYYDPSDCGTYHILDLTVNKTYQFYEHQQICEVETPCIWRGQYLYNSGMYYDSLLTDHTQCDSVYMLRLDVWSSPIVTNSITLCHGDYADINGRHITQAGIYDDTLHTQHGCDSIIRLIVSYTPFQLHESTKHINRGENYEWYGHLLTETGIYEETIKSKVHPTCDSIVYRLNLVVDNIREISICQGDAFEFRGEHHYITERTVFTDTLLDSHGNDSVLKYVVNVLPTYNFIEYRTLCSTDYYPWHGQTLHQAGVYYDRNLTVDGCDSIYEIHITLAEAFDERTDVLLMPEELPYTWRGRQFWVDTMQVDSFRTYAGCDSLYTLDLKLCNKYNSKIDTFSMCPGTTIVVAGREYDHGGLYKLQFATATSGNRPDSIYRFFIKELKSEYTYDSLRVAESEFTNGIVYNYKGLINITSKKDSVYKISTSNDDGCESVIELHFGVLRSKYTTVPMTVCQGTMIWYNNSWNRVESSGLITDKLFTSEGGDSIVTYVINILPTPMTEHEILLCNNDTFKISRVGGPHPLLITEPGIYLDTLTSRAGCDSIIKYIANRAESYFIERVDSIAKGGTYKWHRDGHERLITGAGVYWDSCRTVHGCDSIYKLTLIAFTEPQATHNINLCSGDSFTLRDDNGDPYVVTDPGVYYEKLWNAAGQQDSVIRYIVNRALSYTINDTVTIERGETYHWADTVISNAGDYRRTLLTVHGCDSVFNLHLIIDNTYRSEERLTICYEDRPYLWRGQQCFFSGMYYDSIHSDFAGDSVFHLDLTIQPEIEKTLVEAKLCYGDVLYIRDQRIDKAGTYYDTLTSMITGCDSVIQYIVNEYPTFQYEETRVMCNGGSVAWRGKTFSREGIYWDSLQTVHGCDSVFKLTVINTSTYALDTTVVWCWDDLPYRHFNGRYSTYYDVKDFPQGSRTFIDTLISSNGCDSITRTHVILTNKCNRDLDTIYYCQGQEYPNIIGGQAIDHEGVYYFNEWTFDGYSAKLDSVHRAIAIEARTYYFYESYTACQGDMTEVHDGFIPGAYPVGERTIPVYLKTQHGCDSVYYIDLTVYPSYHHNVSNWQMRDIDIDYLPFKDHNGEDVTFVINGSQCSTGKHDTILVTRTETGCEETFNLTLTVIPTTYKTEDVRICYLNLPYTYQDYNTQTGMMETVEAYDEGVYLSHYYRPGGNVSTVTTINLYVDTEAKLDTAWVEINCQQTKGGSSDMAIMFESSGSRPTEYDLVFSKNALSEGFANVKGAKVTKSGQIDVQWPTFKQSEKYVRPDNTYYVDVTLTNGACGTSADNTRRLYFGVKYPAWITESLFNHTIAILNENYNGGYIFSNYSWFVNDSYVPTDKPYIYDPDGTIISEGDSYHVELTRLGENYSIPTCEKVYIPGEPVTGRPHLIIAASGNQHATPIRMKAYGEGTYYIYSQTGQFCGSGEFHQGEQDILLPEVKGCYIIRMQQKDGEINSEKAMIF